MRKRSAIARALFFVWYNGFLPKRVARYQEPSVDCCARDRSARYLRCSSTASGCAFVRGERCERCCKADKSVFKLDCPKLTPYAKRVNIKSVQIDDLLSLSSFILPQSQMRVLRRVGDRPCICAHPFGLIHVGLVFSRFSFVRSPSNSPGNYLETLGRKIKKEQSNS